MVVDESTVQQVTLPISSDIGASSVENQENADESSMDKSNPPLAVPEPISDTSPNSSFNVTPSDILPLPKMSTRRVTKRKRKSEKAVELTTEDYRQSLATAEATKTIKMINKDRKPPKKRNKVQRLQESTEDTLCELCVVCFSNSTDGSGWKKCLRCLKWFHFTCNTTDKSICHLCD